MNDTKAAELALQLTTVGQAIPTLKKLMDNAAWELEQYSEHQRYQVTLPGKPGWGTLSPDTSIITYFNGFTKSSPWARYQAAPAAPVPAAR